MMFLLGIVSARSAIRLVMILVAPASIILGFFIVHAYSKAEKSIDSKKTFAWIIFFLILIATIFSGYTMYKETSNQASSYGSNSVYTQQWQKAMSWVRENTPQSAIFAHWWDYGYWIQSIGERATVLDGGNAKSYWNHLMGRYALTGTSNTDALEFLYAHNTTHFLIDSTDIGKYTAFSFIGSNTSLDRRSWLSVMLRDNSQIKETKNSTIILYAGGTSLDEDIIYNQDDKKIFLPADKAGLGAVLVELDEKGSIKQPLGVFVYQNQQYSIPFRYAYYNGIFTDFGSGIESGVYIFSRINDAGSLEQNGALIYLSKRTVKSQLARLYLYKEENPYFKLAHSEDDFVIEQIKTQNPDFKEDIIYYQGFRGPIRIWEVSYPQDIEFKEEYLSIDYPTELRLA
jgi:asparagine N-glycosylation enzyme membrane subunit Stt3